MPPIPDLGLAILYADGEIVPLTLRSGLREITTFESSQFFFFMFRCIIVLIIL